MSDLISRDDLIRKYGDWYIEEGTDCGYIGCLKNLISEEPAIDAEPVRHGKWLKSELFNLAPECSECGAIVTMKPVNYCPFCGAKMDGGDCGETDRC